MEKTYHLMATAAAGLESLVGKELERLGYEHQVENYRVRFDGTQKDILNTNIWLRTADRIKIIVGEFDATTFDQLFEGVKALPWEDYLNYDSEFPVAGRSKKSELFSVPDVQAITKKAIVNRLQEAYHIRTRLPENGYFAQLEVMIDKDHVMVTLDTTGESLFKRGYRVNKGGAPLKENFAAALVLLTNWHPDRPFVDPTTGSGTIAIEAALIGRNIAPGLIRDFDIESMDWFDKKLSDKVRDAAEAQADYDRTLDIEGFDIDENMVDIARENAKHAGLGQDITFKQLAAKDWTTDKLNGVLVTNPPYGERLGELEAARELYEQMGSVYRNLPSWSKYILTSDLEFEKSYGEKATKRRKLYNGALRVDYFQYWGKRVR
ncbi:class I SAM-dependent RNA methyltransferase [Leuconostoc mesenteroides]|uniref:Predicted N6-adenine-specific DNA methylase n=1 Tax=Leuconostoc mesenteroides subsp. mesenteroides (strain ATCC 8293 / DSM 20343 / BCRC 11652 / CCM 1803 / JCM 6124 / NCDO 523 / NBRC 100496 / NCIMB 8023 / NCTC 12954 / NRRL B-1118 / 37Y) TaxID=203120 RepID=Q03WF1_LEUMM|nr:class I SAM-dependent RNA methyltransferase [Leuconostoc mesenteroides]ABJ62471.1 Predicted N6-adenine-specific DNA methylase [Leuconostoc mesenteroides subsp. mesenteroides ATCC 8293]KAA8377698.1 class I SAM-dependent RNA methyltransferase [Leuconostoc mesenteroides]MCJ2158842.1 class I SAM-dependent RNA methyltransferase [Leuconostoc mesenteroides]MCM6835734.1 class I SAM-dependent RNA methyltransferase [Leuconostoc mesenteroides]MCT3042834.1 class I SAM-dependent RNA methyltransferase [L